MAEFKLAKKLKKAIRFKRFVARLVLLSFIHQNLAFATNSIIELDVQGSQTPQRLHVILPRSNVTDVNHIEIDTEQQQVIVYTQRQQADKPDELQEALPSSESFPKANNSILIPKYDVINLPWELESEKLTQFILQQTAWLTPLGEDGYRLEFRGRLLGGMMKEEITVTVKPDCSNPSLGWSRTEICQKYNIHPPAPPNGSILAFLSDNSNDFMKPTIEQAKYNAQMMIYNSQLMAHNARVDQLLKAEKEKLEQQWKKLKEKEDRERQEQREIEKQKQEYPVFYGEYEHFKKVHHLARTEKSYETVFKYSDSLGYNREFVKSIDWKKISFSFKEYLQSYNPFYDGYEEFKQIHHLARTEKSYETVFKYSDPLGYDRSFVKSIDWKSTYTFETYLQFYNLFYQDYNQIKEIHRLVNTVNYPEVFKYSSPLGYSEEFVKSIPYKEPMKSFEGYMTEVFDDQVLEDWGAKDWRESFRTEEGEPQIIKVGLFKDILKFGIQKGSGLLKQGWQKAVQAYKGEIVKGLKIDNGTLNKIPKELGDFKLNRKGVGVRWGQNKGKNLIRIDKGDPTAHFPSQRVDHVRINSNNQILDKNGNAVQSPNPSKTEEAHIPLEIWRQWKDWNKP